MASWRWMKCMVAKSGASLPIEHSNINPAHWQRRPRKQALWQRIHMAKHFESCSCACVCMHVACFNSCTRSIQQDNDGSMLDSNTDREGLLGSLCCRFNVLHFCVHCELPLRTLRTMLGMDWLQVPHSTSMRMRSNQQQAPEPKRCLFYKPTRIHTVT